MAAANTRTRGRAPIGQPRSLATFGTAFEKLPSFSDALQAAELLSRRLLETFTNRSEDALTRRKDAAAARVQAVARGRAARRALSDAVASSSAHALDALPLVLEHPSLMRYKLPTLVVPVRALLALDRLQSHVDLAAKGLLVEWQPGMGAVWFVSHAWLRADHADNTVGSKFALLREVLTALIDGRGDVVAHPQLAFLGAGAVSGALRLRAARVRKDLLEGYVWLDYCSLGRPDAATQLMAIASLPRFVTEAAYFLRLVGPRWAHEDGSSRDLHTWTRRGWMQLEALANVLSARPKPVIVASSASAIHTVPPSGLAWRGWSPLWQTVCAADFTQLEDRERLQPVVSQLIASRKQAAVLAGDGHGYRVLHALEPRLLDVAAAGTGGGAGSMLVESLLEGAAMEGGSHAQGGGGGGRAERDADDDASLDDWLQAMQFAGVTARDAVSGMTPLHFAVLSGRRRLVMGLLDARASIDAVSGMRVPTELVSLPTAATPLLLASFAREQPNLIELLLQHNASAGVEAPRVGNALHAACAGGHLANASALLRAAPSLANQVNAEGVRPFRVATSAALLSAHQAQLQVEVADDAAVAAGGRGSLLMHALMRCGGSTDLITLLLAAGCDPNRSERWGGPAPAIMGTPPTSRARSLMRLWLDTAAARVGLRRAARCATSPTELTPLHRACADGNEGALDALLAGGGDANAVCARSRVTPLMVAASHGHSQLAARLLAAGALPDARDVAGHSAAWWAARGGHHTLVGHLTNLRRTTEIGGGAATDAEGRGGAPTHIPAPQRAMPQAATTLFSASSL